MDITYTYDSNELIVNLVGISNVYLKVDTTKRFITLRIVKGMNETRSFKKEKINYVLQIFWWKIHGLARNKTISQKDFCNAKILLKEFQHQLNVDNYVYDYCHKEVIL